MIIRDKQDNAALPATAVDWFVDKNAASCWLSGYDLSTVGPRYQILMDKTFNLNIAGGATDQPVYRTAKWSSYKKMQVIYNIGNAGTIADIIKGGILFAAYTDQAANGPSYQFEHMVKFKDA